MKYIPVFHPSGVALRSKSVPDGFVTKDFTNKWNNSVYSRLSKMLCGFKNQVRARPSGEKCGLSPGLHLEFASSTQADSFMTDRMNKFELLGM
jgi:hypothetical protein